MKIIEGFEKAKLALNRQSREEPPDDNREKTVLQIVNDVRQRGDAALLDIPKNSTASGWHRWK